MISWLSLWAELSQPNDQTGWDGNYDKVRDAMQANIKTEISPPPPPPEKNKNALLVRPQRSWSI